MTSADLPATTVSNTSPASTGAPAGSVGEGGFKVVTTVNYNSRGENYYPNMFLPLLVLMNCGRLASMCSINKIIRYIM